jgi:hypothetical protein
MTQKRDRLGLIVSGIFGFCVLVFAFRQLGVMRDLEAIILGPYAPEWSAADMANYLNVPFPDDAVAVQYSSFRGQGSFKLSFKAPPASAEAFAQPLCFGALHRGYDPFIASNANEPNAPEAIIIQADNEHYYYSASPSSPKTLFGNRCLGDNGRVSAISIDKADSSLYLVSLSSSNACNDPALPAPCIGKYIIPRGYDSLLVNAAPQAFEPNPGELSGWQIKVREGRHYEAIITLLKPKWIAPDVNVLHFWAEPQGVGEHCDGCRADVHGPATSIGLKLSFVGSITGTSNLSIFWPGDSGLCTIQVREANN